MIASGDQINEEQLDIWSALSILVEQRWSVVFTMALVLVGGGFLVVAGALGREYVADASFFPQEPASSGGRLAGLAAQFGVSVSSGGTVETPEFYGGLLRSRRILSQLAEDTFTVSTEEGTRRADLIELLGPDEAPSRAWAREATIRRLRERHLSVNVVQETGVVSYSVTAPHAELAQAMAQRIMDFVHEFNVGTRRGRAAAEREFVEDRLEEARQELDRAERDLQTFLEQNRQFSDSPELLFRNERMQRQVTMQQEIVVSLVKAVEEARLEQLRNTPVVTVVERPEVPARAQPYPLVRNFIIVLLFSGMAGLAVGLFRGAMAQTSQIDEGGYQRWRRAVEGLDRDRRRLLGRAGIGSN